MNQKTYKYKTHNHIISIQSHDFLSKLWFRGPKLQEFAFDLYVHSGFICHLLSFYVLNGINRITMHRLIDSDIKKNKKIKSAEKCFNFKKGDMI